MKQRTQRRMKSHRYTSSEATAVLQRRHLWRWARAFRARLQHAQAYFQQHLNDLHALAILCQPPKDHHVGDYVTRGGDDVQLVTFISDDGFSGSYTCVVAPKSGWCAVGDVESNLTRRYKRTEYRPEGADQTVSPQVAADAIRAMASLPSSNWPSLALPTRLAIWRMVAPYVAQWPLTDQMALRAHTQPNSYFKQRMLDIASAIAPEGTPEEQPS